MTPADRTAWVIALDVDCYAKAVLHVLAFRANAKSGRCWPSMVTLAKESGMSVRKAREVTRQLHLAGLIDVSISIGKSSNSYVVKFGANPAQRAALDDIQPGTACRVKASQPGTTRKPTRHSVPINPAQRADITGKEQVIEQPAPAAPSVWDIGKQWISGDLLGRCIREHSAETVAQAITATDLKRPGDPKTYLLGILKSKKQAEAHRAEQPW